MNYMGVFGNEGYVDYTLLKKRGLLKESEKEVKSENTGSGFIDFTSSISNTNNSTNSSPQANVGNPFDLLSSLTSSSNNSNSFSESSSPASSIYPANSSSGDDVNALKLKIEDLEYKLQRLIERIDAMNIGK